MKREVITCKECIYFSATTFGMPYACWKQAVRISEDGKYGSIRFGVAIEDPDHFCSYAKRGDEE